MGAIRRQLTALKALRSTDPVILSMLPLPDRGTLRRVELDIKLSRDSVDLLKLPFNPRRTKSIGPCCLPQLPCKKGLRSKSLIRFLISYPSLCFSYYQQARLNSKQVFSSSLDRLVDWLIYLTELFLVCFHIQYRKTKV